MIKKIFMILDKKETRRLVGLFFLILISAALDLVGISIVLPIVSLLLVGSEGIESSKVLSLVSKIFKTTDVNTLFIIVIILMVSLFLIKTVYGLFYSYISDRFGLNYGKKLTSRLMHAYLYMPYEYHLDNNSSTLIRKSVYDVNYFLYTIGELLGFLVKIITFIAILAYLFTISWTITLVTGVLSILFSVVLIFILRPKTRKIAEEVQKLNSNNYKFLSQAFLSIKESKISGKEDNLANVYDNNRDEINKRVIVKDMFSSIPSKSIEFVGILGICLSLLLLRNVLHVDNNYIVTTFSVFVYAVIKLLPIIISSTTTINNLSYYKASIDTIYKDLEDAKQYIDGNSNNEYKKVSFVKSINLNNVSFSYKSQQNKEILDDVSLSIKKNSIVAFFGPSGGGKTTLVDIMLGLLKPTKGSITVDGEDIVDNFKGWRENVSYIPQTIYLSDDSIIKNVAFGVPANEIDIERVKDALKKAELDTFVDSLEKKEETIIGENGIRLSGGQRQRIGIARAFYRNTNIIVFDEATSALDYETEKHIFEHISSFKEDHTLIIITHREESLKIADDIYKVDNCEITKVK